MNEQQEFQYVPIAALRESKTNPRRQQNKVALRELIESVRARGVLVPLLARPVDGNFEIVAGSRRYRAAREAGLETVPVRVQPMTDREVLEVQLIENLQREDINALEEGLGYQTLMQESKLDVVEIAAKIAKSPSYIYQRLKLAELIKPVQQAFLGNNLTAGHAILIARLQPTDQREALRYCGSKFDGERASVRQLSVWIQKELHLNLNAAPFKMADAELLPKAGPCTTCPKRAGSNPDLFEGLKKDTCTDRTCYQAKITAHISRKEAELIGAGESVVSISSHYGIDERRKGNAALPVDEWEAVKKGSCPHVKKGIVMDGTERGQVLNVCTDPRCKTHHSHPSTQQQAPSPSEIRRREKEQEETIARARIFRAVINKAPQTPGRKDLELFAFRFFLDVEDWSNARKWIIAKAGWKEKFFPGSKALDYKGIARANIPKLPNSALVGLLVSLALMKELHPTPESESGKTLHEVAKRYRVNTAKIAREVRAELQAKRKAKAEQEKKRKRAEKAAAILLHQLHPKKAKKTVKVGRKVG